MKAWVKEQKHRWDKTTNGYKNGYLPQFLSLKQQGVKEFCYGEVS